MAGGPVTVTRRSPVGLGVEMERLAALGAVCAVLEWPQPTDDDDDDDDASVPAATVAAICRALMAETARIGGQLAFRWHAGQPLPSGPLRHHPAPRRSLADLVLAPFNLARTARFAVIVTADEAVVRQMFAWDGWPFGAQAALVHRADAPDAARAVAALGRGMDWRAAPLPAGASLLFGTGHDGAFALVAAADDATLSRFCAAVNPPP